MNFSLEDICMHAPVSDALILCVSIFVCAVASPESVLIIPFVCCLYGPSVKEKNCLSRIVHVFSEITGVQLTHLEETGCPHKS